MAKYDGETCPKDGCGGKIEVTGGIMSSDQTTAYQNVRCDKCKTQFVEAYTLTALDEFDSEGDLVTTHEVG